MSMLNEGEAREAVEQLTAKLIAATRQELLLLAAPLLVSVNTGSPVRFEVAGRLYLVTTREVGHADA